MKYVVVEGKISLERINESIRVGLAPSDFKRSRGLHLSDITSRIRKESEDGKERIIFGRNSLLPIDEEDLAPCMALGMSWEQTLLGMYPWMARVGEIVKDNIAMTPDAVAFNCKRHLLSPHKAVTCLVECKVTWKSSRKSLEEHLGYLRQMKSYCHALNTPWAMLVVFFVNGNYVFGGDPEGGPHFKFFHIEFTPFELLSNWQYILRKKSDYGL